MDSLSLEQCVRFLVSHVRSAAFAYGIACIAYNIIFKFGIPDLSM